MPFIGNEIGSKKAKQVSNRICKDFIVSTKATFALNSPAPEVEISHHLVFDKTSTDLKNEADSSAINHRPASSVVLSESAPSLGIGLETAILGRVSEREFSEEPMTLNMLSAFLLSAYGGNENITWINEPLIERSGIFQPAKCLGEGSPIDLYLLVVGKVHGIKRGLYYHEKKKHLLQKLTIPCSIGKINDHLPILSTTKRPKVVFLIVGKFKSVATKYGGLGYRLVFSEAGHVQAHLALAAQALGRGYFNFGGGYDREIEDLLKINGIDKALIGIGISG